MGAEVYATKEECYKHISDKRLLEGTTCKGSEAQGYRIAYRKKVVVGKTSAEDILWGVFSVTAGIIVAGYAVGLLETLLNNRHCHDNGERVLWHEHSSGDSHGYLGRQCSLFDDDED